MTKRRLAILTRANIIIVAISVLICCIYALEYFFAKDYFMMGGSIAVIVLPLLVYILERLIKRWVSEIVKFVYLVFIFMSGVLGAIANFYGTVPFYDKVVHFTSGLLLASLIVAWFKRFNTDKKYNLRDQIIFIVCFNATAAVFWEIGEFTFDFVFKKHVQKGLNDTMGDMIVAIVGSILVALIYVAKYNKKKFTTKQKPALR